MILIWDIFGKSRFRGITLFPFIILKKDEYKHNKVLINHERIHLTQQSEMYVIFFYLFYGLEWLIKRLKYKDAYRNLSFEREAYAYQHNLGYLEKREKFAWLKYL